MTQKEDWTKAIIELETFFSSIVLPKTYHLFNYLYITDVKHFIKTHLDYCKCYNGKKVMKIYLYRLIKLKNLLSNV